MEMLRRRFNEFRRPGLRNGEPTAVIKRKRPGLREKEKGKKKQKFDNVDVSNLVWLFRVFNFFCHV